MGMIILILSLISPFDNETFYSIKATPAFIQTELSKLLARSDSSQALDSIKQEKLTHTGADESSAITA